MKFLILQHVPHEHPGLITKYAKDKGIDLEMIELWKPYHLPSADNADALIVMGGPMAVYEEFPSKQDELQFIKRAAGKLPILGLCLGAQLLAGALGANVYPNERDGEKVKEIGYYDVDLTPEGAADPLFAGFASPVKVLQWHGDTFDLPEGAVLLAAAPACRNQAFRFGKNAYGLQFHTEFTPDMVERQIEFDNKWIHEGFDFDEAGVARQAHETAAIMEAQNNKLFDNFVFLLGSV